MKSWFEWINLLFTPLPGKFFLCTFSCLDLKCEPQWYYFWRKVIFGNSRYCTCREAHQATHLPSNEWSKYSHNAEYYCKRNRTRRIPQADCKSLLTGASWISILFRFKLSDQWTDFTDLFVFTLTWDIGGQHLLSYFFIRTPWELLALKGTVQRDFLPPIFSLIDSSQAIYSVYKDFSNLASNLVRY